MDVYVITFPPFVSFTRHLMGWCRGGVTSYHDGVIPLLLSSLIFFSIISWCWFKFQLYLPCSCWGFQRFTCIKPSVDGGVKSDVSANEKRNYICFIFCHWLKSQSMGDDVTYVTSSFIAWDLSLLEKMSHMLNLLSLAEISFCGRRHYICYIFCHWLRFKSVGEDPAYVTSSPIGWDLSLWKKTLHVLHLLSLAEISVCGRRHYMCYIFSHWLRSCSAWLTWNLSIRK